ncbi:hypothetical protein ACFC0D_25375 [Streptomyces sp. NPDC056222]|uniref:hypothetical protein n=1 Tax=Streptomyces sp. NPDC056222 TaxID=3345749 RepID=UPI0035DE74C8
MTDEASRGGVRRGPTLWLLLTAVCCCGLFLIFVMGASAGGLDVREACGLAGQDYDEAYRAEHWQEPSRLFPLHNKCNASFDLVPAWINPTLVCLTVAAGACAITGMATARAGRARERAAVTGGDRR